MNSKNKSLKGLCTVNTLANVEFSASKTSRQQATYEIKFEAPHFCARIYFVCKRTSNSRKKFSLINSDEIRHSVYYSCVGTRKAKDGVRESNFEQELYVQRASSTQLIDFADCDPLMDISEKISARFNRILVRLLSLFRSHRIINKSWRHFTLLKPIA